jgi:hypothetical protein
MLIRFSTRTFPRNVGRTRTFIPPVSFPWKGYRRPCLTLSVVLDLSGKIVGELLDFPQQLVEVIMVLVQMPVD